MKLPWYMKERGLDNNGNSEMYITCFGRIYLFFKIIVWDALEDFSITKHEEGEDNEDSD